VEKWGDGGVEAHVRDERVEAEVDGGRDAGPEHEGA
jgi:hypothetical protein